MSDICYTYFIRNKAISKYLLVDLKGKSPSRPSHTSHHNFKGIRKQFILLFQNKQNPKMKILKMLEKMVVRIFVRKVPMFISEGNGDDDGGKDGGNVLIVSLHFHPPILIK